MTKIWVTTHILFIFYSFLTHSLLIFYSSVYSYFTHILLILKLLTHMLLIFYSHVTHIKIAYSYFTHIFICSNSLSTHFPKDNNYFWGPRGQIFFLNKISIFTGARAEYINVALRVKCNMFHLLCIGPPSFGQLCIVCNNRFIVIGVVFLGLSWFGLWGRGER